MNLEGAIDPLLPQVLQKPEWQSLLREPLEWFNTRPRVLPLCSHSVLQRALLQPRTWGSPCSWGEGTTVQPIWLVQHPLVSISCSATETLQ